MDAVHVIPMKEKTKNTREVVTMNRAIPVACFLFLAITISSCDQSTSNKSTQTNQQSSSTSSTVNNSKSDENLVPLVTEEEKRRAEEQHKEATKNEILNKGDDNSGKIRLY
ncbi:MAG: hypothetical protein HQQ73_03575 [Desulfobulbaceae bacterium]|nr:hypothetical protein [Desulfobulbaceae bacterium]